jgi:hypothetical protein
MKETEVEVPFVHRTKTSRSTREQIENLKSGGSGCVSVLRDVPRKRLLCH